MPIKRNLKHAIETFNNVLVHLCGYDSDEDFDEKTGDYISSEFAKEIIECINDVMVLILETYRVLERHSVMGDGIGVNSDDRPCGNFDIKIGSINDPVYEQINHFLELNLPAEKFEKHQKLADAIYILNMHGIAPLHSKYDMCDRLTDLIIDDLEDILDDH